MNLKLTRFNANSLRMQSAGGILRGAGCDQRAEGGRDQRGVILDLLRRRYEHRIVLVEVIAEVDADQRPFVLLAVFGRYQQFEDFAISLNRHGHFRVLAGVNQADQVGNAEDFNPVEGHHEIALAQPGPVRAAL